MSEKTVRLRHDQICDLCRHRIRAGDMAYMTRDDFWPSLVWFEHVGGCPKGAAAGHSPHHPSGSRAAAAAAADGNTQP